MHDFRSPCQSVQQQAIIKTRGKLSLTGKKIPGRRIQGAFVKIKNGNIHESDTDELNKEQAEKRYRASLAEIRRLEEELKISADSANVLLEALNEARQQEVLITKSTSLCMLLQTGTTSILKLLH